jgi:Zn-dependent membrane protease YugP
MVGIVLFLLILALVLGPQLWVKGVMRRYAMARDDFPGTGGELARHLLDRFEVSGVRVEPTDIGDHYDPLEKAVRLTPGNYDGKSLTAITIAAHEVGHAIQDHIGYQPLAMRGRLVQLAGQAQRLGAVMMMGTPLIVALLKAPAAGLLMVLAGFLSLGSAVVVHLVTLPVEMDASFNRALPMLESGGYITERDRPAARRILRAAALTYVSSALMSLLNVWQWIRMLRR